ncbi:MAG: DUF4199 family protein [Bacteroidetes bacterium]|nr:DUF4199 family protein [Bacteroidota bacterium]
MNIFSSIKNNGVRFGLLAGLLTLAYFGLFYFVDKAWMLSPVVYYGSLFIYLWAMYQAIREESKAQQAMLSWKDALRTGFVVFLIANAFFIPFFVLLHATDPVLEDIQRASLREWYPRIIPKDQLAEQLRQLETADLKMDPKEAVFAYARAAIGGFIMAAFLAILHRRDSIKF